ncbi:hypothetical protein GCM10007422_37180 [Pedobacter zeae]|nr:hypothetical protein GCM10007422_37180 [Pedobacter zeae]
MLIVSIAVSCKKDVVGATDSEQSVTLKKKFAVTPETPNPGGGLGNAVVKDTNGDYITAYGGGINFGNVFTHPLTIQSYQNGTPFAPSYSGGYSPANMLSFTQHGESFVMILGTAVGGLPSYDMSPLTLSGIQKYETDIDKWLNGEIAEMLHLANSIAYTGGNSSGLISITGTFVLDNQSPTNVSVTSIKYKPTLVE